MPITPCWRAVAGLLLGLSVGSAGQAAPTRDGAGLMLASPARRAIALAPHAVELVYAAGAGDYLIATVQGSDYPAAARALPSIGDGTQPDAERVAALKPDLLIAWQAGAAAPLERIMGRLQVPVYYSDPQSLADIPDAIEQMGRLFGTEPQAHAAAQAWRARLAALQARYSDRPTLRVFIQAGLDPIFSLNRHSIVSDAVRICGGVNVFDAAPVLAPQITLEALLTARPDAIVAGVTSPAENLANLRAWQAKGVPAALQGKVYGIDADMLYRPGPRLIDAAEQLCAALEQARR